MATKQSWVKDVADAVPLGGAIYGIGNAIFGQSQADYQKEQIEGAKEMGEFNREKAMQMWHDTNYGAQKKELIDADMNPALLYGTSGGGGVTTNTAGSPMPTGQVAPNSAELGQFGLQTAQTMANIELMKSQAEKNRVEAEKTAGIDTKQGEATLTGQTFQNKINELVTAEKEASKRESEITKASNEADITMYQKDRLHEDLQAWEKASFADNATITGEGPLAESLRNTYKRTKAELELAKTQNDIAKAEAAIKQMSAKLAEFGIDDKSPWYMKIFGTIANAATK